MLALLLSVLVCATPVRAEIERQRFRIQVTEDAVYKVGYDQLASAGLSGPVASDGLALTNLGQPVAMRVDDGGDRQFGPGDNLVFVGRHLRGETGHYHEHSPFNVYVLDVAAAAEPLRMIEGHAPAGLPVREPLRPRQTVHLERDLLRVPLSGPSGKNTDETLWYWLQLNHLASQPTGIPIDLSRLDRSAKSSLDLKLQFRGGSDSATAAYMKIPDHVVEIALNGTQVGSGRWSGRGVNLIEISGVPVHLVEPEGNVIEVRVPLRRYGEEGDSIIDVVYLDWLQLEFAHDSAIDDRQQRITVATAGSGSRLRLVAAGNPAASELRRVELFADDGSNPAVGTSRLGPNSPTVFEASIPDGVKQLWIVPDGHFRAPGSIVLDRPSKLAESTDQRDYFIIAHASLVDAVEPLARFHDQRGLRTELVDVQDIYDEFNHGIKHPRAIREFLMHARESRQAPAPGHVLLVGDANWLARATPEANDPNADHGARDLIPTWHLGSRDGPAASDNPFVTLEGDDFHPDMAIGRFPARSAAEARSMVDKTVAYMQDTPPGDWRSRIMLVSDSTRNLSARNVPLAQRARDRGLRADELRADPAGDGARNRAALRSALNDGMLVLHFFGHGGRFMWQIGPSAGDAGNLFDMDDLDQLAPSARLPIVLSMSCATGPFDHPAADSLAEKFLRVQGRGAVAVLAASARNSPSLQFTNVLLEGILEKGTLGEAVQTAKRERMHPDAALFYNLLGDPALVPARPGLGLKQAAEAGKR